MELIFLGTGGGRFVTGKQTRNTGGIVVKTDETQLHIDPGPGALLQSHKNIEVEESEAVLVSHAHLDHYSDAEPIIEMITEAYNNACYLFGNETSLNGFSDIEKSISNYHQQMCAETTILDEETSTNFKDITINSQQMFHNDPKTIGFTIEDKTQKIGFWTDTQYSEELISLYEDTDIMVIYCTRPRNKDYKGHTALSDVPKIMNKIEAETCIITHFGMKFLNSDMNSQKDWLKEQIDGKVLFAEDNMKFPGNRTLNNF